MAPRPWKRLGTGNPIDFEILRIREDRVEHPGTGAEHPRVIIECPDWVNIIPVTPEGQLVLVRQFRFGTWSATLELPGGMVDEGESPEQAAVRELEEETGYRPKQVLDLGYVHPNPALQGNRCHSFLALGCEPTGVLAQEAGEDIEVELHPRSAVPGLIRSGQITHSLVVGAFLLERLRAEQG
jgi:ADP-ribose pyrophosphatase